MVDKNNILLDALNLINENKFQEAIKVLDVLIELDPSIPEAYFWKAKCFESLILEEYIEDFEYQGKVVGCTVSEKKLKKDYRLKETIRLYELALDLSPEDRRIIDAAISFYSMTFIVQEDLLESIFDKWLKNHPEDVSILYERAVIAFEGYDFNNAPTLDRSIAFFRKTITKIEATYECVNIDYTGNTVPGKKTETKILKNPDKVLKKHKDLLDDSLSRICTAYAIKKDYENLFEYFWKLFSIRKDRDTLEYLTGIILEHCTEVNISSRKLGQKRKKPGRKKELLSLRNELGLIDESKFERRLTQDLLIDACYFKIKEGMSKKLIQKYGPDWWAEGVPGDIHIKVNGMKSRENRYPHLPERPPIEYLDLKDHGKIIIQNWEIFKKSIKSTNYLNQDIIEPLNNYRNRVKHTSELLSDTSIKDLQVIKEKIDCVFV